MVLKIFSWRRSSKVRRSSQKESRWMNTLRRLGSGGFGCVYEGLDLETGELVALKHLGKDSETYNRESSLLAKLSHPNVVQYKGSFTDATASWIVMEYCGGGCIGSLLQRVQVLPISVVQRYLKGILQGLAYLHSMKIVHCDVKPSNILLQPDGTPKLSDFGISKYQSSDSSPGLHGSLQYMPPENKMTYAGDIWALGITVLEMLEGSNMDNAINYAKGQAVPSWLPDVVKDFLGHCLHADPSKRWTCSQLLHHPFIRESFAVPSMRKPQSAINTLGQLQHIMDLPSRRPSHDPEFGDLVVSASETLECLPGQLVPSLQDTIPKQDVHFGSKSQLSLYKGFHYA